MFLAGWEAYGTFVRLSSPQLVDIPSEAPVVASDNMSVDVAFELPAMRPVYPYSVIRGGVYSAGELSNALRTDPVAAAHYADFGSAHVQLVQLTEARRAYVSFRKDDRIYWTRKPILLAQGETVLSDGNHQARARCGNRISATPLGPVLPEDPPAPDWEEPVDWEAPSPAPNLVDPGVPTPSSTAADLFAPPNLTTAAASATGSPIATGSID